MERHERERSTAERTAEEQYGNLILSTSEYVRHPFARNPEGRTYAYALTGSGKRLYVFGSEHIHDPHDPLYGEIDSAFKDAGPDMVYVEGMEGIEHNREGVVMRMRDTSLAEARKLGENVYTLKLAVDAGIPFESPEPSHRDEIRYLERMGFPREIIYGQTFYRSVVQFQRTYGTTSPAAFREYLAPYRSRFLRDSGWDADAIADIEAHLLGSLDLEDTETYKRKLDPMPWQGVHQSSLNSLSAASTEYRDRHILGRIADGLSRHDSLFVTYGSGHAVSLEPALRALMEHLPPQSDKP